MIHWVFLRNEQLELSLCRLVLELNLIKKQWKNYATIDLSGKGVKSIISKGNMTIKSSKEEHVPH